MAGDQALMEALKVIDKNEAHIKYLETSVTSLTGQITKLTNDKEILYKQMAELKADNERLREATGGGGDLQVKEVRHTIIYNKCITVLLLRCCFFKIITFVCSSIDCKARKHG